MLDRQPGPALETSFANAGEISPGYATSWAAPGIPLKALKWLFMPHSPLFIRPTMMATSPLLTGPELNSTEYFTYSAATWELREE